MGAGSSSLVRRRKKKKGAKESKSEVWRRYSAVEPRKMASAVRQDMVDHMDVDIWLSILGLSKYQSNFARFRGVEDLFGVQECDLKLFGVRSRDDREKIMTSLRNLQHQQAFEKSCRLKTSASSGSLNSIRSLVNLPTSQEASCADYEELNPVPSSISGKRILSQSSVRKNKEEDVMDPQHIKKMLEWELSLDSDDLRSHAWYHGSIPRSHAERILLHDEEFLVRDCGSKPGSFVMSCRYRHAFYHFVVNKVLVQQGTIYERVQYQFEEESFDSVSGLITYYVGSNKPVSNASGARIRHPRNRLYPLTYFPNQLSNPEHLSTAGSPRSTLTSRSSPSIFASVRGARSSSRLQAPSESTYWASASTTGRRSNLGSISQQSGDVLTGGNRQLMSESLYVGRQNQGQFFGGVTSQVSLTSTLGRRAENRSLGVANGASNRSPSVATIPATMGQQTSCVANRASIDPVSLPGGNNSNLPAVKSNKSESDLLDRSADQCQKARHQKGANASHVGSSRSLPRSAAGLIRAKMAAALSSNDVGDGRGSAAKVAPNESEVVIIESEGEKVALRKRTSTRNSRPPPLVGEHIVPLSVGERDFVQDLERVIGTSNSPCSPAAITHVAVVTGALPGQQSSGSFTAVTGGKKPTADRHSSDSGSSASLSTRLSSNNDLDIIDDDDDTPDYDVPPPPVVAASTRPGSSASSTLKNVDVNGQRHRWTQRSSGSDSGMNSGDSMTSGESLTSEAHLGGSVVHEAASNRTAASPSFFVAMKSHEATLVSLQLGHPALPSALDVENFRSLHFSLSNDTKPLDKDVWASVRRTFLGRPAKQLAAHLTIVDLDVLRMVNEVDLGFGATSGIELLALPDGQQLRSDVIERVNSLSLFVSVSILQGEDDKQRSEMIHLWIQVADELKSSMGNLLGFASVMIGVDSRPVQRLSATWYKVRQTYTDSAHKFEARLRAMFKSINDVPLHPNSSTSCSTSLNSSPNISIPYILPLCAVMDKTPEALLAEWQEGGHAALCPWDPSGKDKTLAHLVSQLEEGLKFAGSSATYRRNALRIVNDVEPNFDVLVCDVFKTEFHLNYLWGRSGATAPQEERFSKFRRVLDALSRKCERGGDNG